MVLLVGINVMFSAIPFFKKLDLGALGQCIHKLNYSKLNLGGMVLLSGGNWFIVAHLFALIKVGRKEAKISQSAQSFIS
ncbi:MAG: hypothetical protein NWQ55_08465, partial [Salibacteraceae bacterium]|nr:hypothetical protein [Salibacteraceae bacterium]